VERTATSRFEYLAAYGMFRKIRLGLNPRRILSAVAGET
jgi:hypothetical protein